MTHPLVTIVTPTYNGAKYLRDAMESVQAQTYPNLVHIVLNNASTDGTQAIIDEFKDGAIPVLSYVNEDILPQRPNWNKAFSLVSKDSVYVRLLCDDDTITPDSISEMVALAEAKPDVGVVGCLHYCKGGVTDFKWPAEQTVFDGKDALKRALLDEGTIMPIHMLWRKSLSDQRDVLFDDYMKGGFDLDTMFDLIRRTKFGFVHKVLGQTGVYETGVVQETMAPGRVFLRDASDLLRKYGAEVFGPDYAEQARRFRRHYVKSVRRWRREGMPDEHLKVHIEGLEKAGWNDGHLLIADAAINKLAIRLGLDKPWTGYPGWL